MKIISTVPYILLNMLFCILVALLSTTMLSFSTTALLGVDKKKRQKTKDKRQKTKDKDERQKT